MRGHLFFAVLVVLLNTACASLGVRLPSARLESPEVAGSWGKRLGFGAGESQDVEITSDASARPPALDSPRSWKGGDMPFKAGLGIGDFLELGVRLGTFTNLSMVTGKIQVLGATSRESKPGDFALAFSAGYGSQSSSKSGDQNGVFGPGGYRWRAEQTTQVYDFALIMGYRLKSWLMIYGGPFTSRLKMSGNIHHDLSDNGTSPAADYALSADGQVSGGNLDFMFTFTERKTFSLTAEISYQTLQWTNLASVTAGRGALLCEWVF